MYLKKIVCEWFFERKFFLFETFNTKKKIVKNNKIYKFTKKKIDNRIIMILPLKMYVVVNLEKKKNKRNEWIKQKGMNEKKEKEI